MPGSYERSFDPVPKLESFYQALRPFQYGDGDEGFLDREVIFKLDPRVSYDRHSKMIRLGMIAEVDPSFLKQSRWSECGTCQQRFMSMGTRDDHVRKRHVKAPEAKIPALSDLPYEERMRIAHETMQGERIGPGEGPGAYRQDGPTLLPGQFDPEMQRIEKEERELNKVAPIFFENTEASRKAGENVIQVQGTMAAAKSAKQTTKKLTAAAAQRKRADTSGGKNVRASQR